MKYKVEKKMVEMEVETNVPVLETGDLIEYRSGVRGVVFGEEIALKNGFNDTELDTSVIGSDDWDVVKIFEVVRARAGFDALLDKDSVYESNLRLLWERE